MAQPLPTPHHPGGRVQTMKQGFEQHILTFNATSVRGLGSCFALSEFVIFKKYWARHHSSFKLEVFWIWSISQLYVILLVSVYISLSQDWIHENWANHFVHKVKSTWGSTTSFSVHFQILLLMLNKLIEINILMLKTN